MKTWIKCIFLQLTFYPISIFCMYFLTLRVLLIRIKNNSYFFFTILGNGQPKWRPFLNPSIPYCCDVWGFSGRALNWSLMIPRNASLSDSSKKQTEQFLLRSMHKINTYFKTKFVYTNKIDPATDNSHKTLELVIFSTNIHLVLN